MKKGALSYLARPGTDLKVRVTPKAARNAVLDEAGGVRVLVTAEPEGGRANAAVARLLARALGIAPTRLELRRGAAARDKVFRIR